MALADGDRRLVRLGQRGIVTPDRHLGRRAVRGGARRLDADGVGAGSESRDRRAGDGGPGCAVGGILHRGIHARDRAVRRAAIGGVGRAKPRGRGGAGRKRHFQPFARIGIGGFFYADINLARAVEGARQRAVRNHPGVAVGGRNLVVIADGKGFRRIIGRKARCRRICRRGGSGLLHHCGGGSGFLRGARVFGVVRSILLLRLDDLDGDLLANIIRREGIGAVSRAGDFFAAPIPLVDDVRRGSAHGQRIARLRRIVALADGDRRFVRLSQRRIAAADRDRGRQAVRGAARRLDADEISALRNGRCRGACIRPR